MKTVFLYVVALVVVVAAFSLALMFAKLALVSAVFMVVALAGLGWLTRGLMQKVRRTRMRPTA